MFYADVYTIKHLKCIFSDPGCFLSWNFNTTADWYTEKKDCDIQQCNY